MKRLLFFAVGLFALASQSAEAMSTVTVGSIEAGHPLTRAVGGASELAAGCNGAAPDLSKPVPQANGVDGYFFTILPAMQGKSGTLSWTATVAADLDVFWFRDNCAEVTNSAWRTDRVGGTESGLIPANAAYGLVNAYSGLQIRFTLRA